MLARLRSSWATVVPVVCLLALTLAWGVSSGLVLAVAVTIIEVALIVTLIASDLPSPWPASGCGGQSTWCCSARSCSSPCSCRRFRHFDIMAS